MLTVQGVKYSQLYFRNVIGVNIHDAREWEKSRSKEINQKVTLECQVRGEGLNLGKQQWGQKGEAYSRDTAELKGRFSY